jgi:hypothetical protein
MSNAKRKAVLMHMSGNDPIPHFDGETYRPVRDHGRLGEQYTRIFNLMKDGEWRTLPSIEEITGDPTSSISARLRDMRKEKFGSHNVERKYVANGLFTYRLLINKADAA